jgi:ADP-ribose pyrophosphatase YjhB (NUDIX family)
VTGPWTGTAAVPDVAEQVTASSRHFTASAVVVDSAGRILLVDHKGFQAWVWPGGHIEIGEAPDETAVREVREETRIAARIVDPSACLGGVALAANGRPAPWRVADFHARGRPEAGEPAHRHVDFLYLAVAVGADSPAAGDDGVTDARFFGIDDIRGLRARDDVVALALLALSHLAPMLGARE